MGVPPFKETSLYSQTCLNVWYIWGACRNTGNDSWVKYSFRNEGSPFSKQPSWTPLFQQSLGRTHGMFIPIYFAIFNKNSPYLESKLCWFPSTLSQTPATVVLQNGTLCCPGALECLGFGSISFRMDGQTVNFLVYPWMRVRYQLLPGCEWTRLLRLLRLHRAPSIVRQHQTNIGPLVDQRGGVSIVFFFRWICYFFLPG